MTGPLDIRGTAQIADRVSPTLAKISAAMAAVSRNPGLQRIGVQLGQVGSALGGVAQSARGVAVNMAAMGVVGAAGVAGLSALAVRVSRKFADVGSEIGDVSARIGISGEALQEWRFAAERAGASTAALDGGLAALNKKIGDVARGKAKDAASLFRKLGINVKDAKGNIKPLSVLLPQIAEAFRKNEDPAKRAAMAAALGGEAFAELIPMLAGGSRGLKDMAADARALGIIIPERNIEAAGQLGDSIDDLGKSFDGLMLSIGAELAPILKPIVDAMKEWVIANRQWIATKVKDAVVGLRDALKEIDFKQLYIDLKGLIVAGKELVSETIGWKAAFIGLAVVMSAPILIPLMSLTAAFIRLGLAIGGVARAALVAGGWPVILGLVVIAGALKEWEGFTAGLQQQWDGVKQIFQGNFFEGWGNILSGQFRSAFSVIRGALGIVDDIFGTELRAKFDGALSWLSGWLTENLVGPVQKAIKAIQDLWNNLTFSDLTGKLPAPNGPRGQTVTPDGSPSVPGAAPAAPSAPAPGRGSYSIPGRQSSLSLPRIDMGDDGAGRIAAGDNVYEREKQAKRAEEARQRTARAALSVEFKNTPPGTSVSSTKDSLFGPLDLNMGYGMRGVG